MPSKSSFELRQQVGQLLIMGFDGMTPSVRLRLLLATMQPGSVILFKRNIEEPAQTHVLLRDVQKVVSTPMFLCVDMEGGTVDRLRDVIAPAPSVAEVAASGSEQLFRKHGRIIGDEVRALGFNTDFAPALDLQIEASKAVLGSRTVSPDPKQTIVYVREFLRGLRDSNVLGCGKHFPGLGEANLDSHNELPAIAKPWKRLWREDLLPYRELRRELPFVMVAHAAYPEVTGDRTPASLSKKWMSAGKLAIGGSSSPTTSTWAGCWRQHPSKRPRSRHCEPGLTSFSSARKKRACGGRLRRCTPGPRAIEHLPGSLPRGHDAFWRQRRSCTR